jgi:hypothetical protein
MANPGACRPGQHRRAIGVECPVREMAVGIHEHAQTAALERPPEGGAGLVGGAGAAVGATAPRPT